jgi:glycosyltransferase involved in cell wall biosynthesis
VARVLIVNNTSVYVHRFRRELIQGLHAAGHEVVLLCPDDAHTYKLADLPVRRVSWPLQQHGTSPRSEWRAARFAVQLAGQIRPDAVINFTLKPAIYGSMAARRVGARCFSVFTGLGYYFTDPARVGSPATRVIRLLLRRALASNVAVYFQNLSDRDLFHSLGLVGSERTRIVNGSGVDVERFRPGDLPVEPHSFILVGRMLVEKGVREYVEAARRVRLHCPQAKFRLLGGIDTSGSAISRAEIDAWQADGTIEYLGEVDDVRPAVARSEVLVLPSYREGMPRSVLEAMAMGKPVVVTDVPGCRDCVDSGVNALIVPARDVESLAAAMQRLASEPGLSARFGQMSRLIAVERFDVRRINDAFLRECGLSTPVADAQGV